MQENFDREKAEVAADIKNARESIDVAVDQCISQIETKMNAVIEQVEKFQSQHQDFIKKLSKFI